MQKPSARAMVITRRDFVKVAAAGSAMLGLGAFSGRAMAATLAAKPGVVWLEGQDCAGCTESVLSCLTPDLRGVLLDTVCMRFHETIMAASGSVAEYALDSAIADGGYVLVVEGSLPTTDNRYLHVGGQALTDTLLAAARPASVVLALGACAAYGGIPRAGVTAGEGVGAFLQRNAISTPVVNLPGCPAHPTWFFDTVTYYLTNNALPALDANKRPTSHYGRRIHASCPRRANFTARKYLTDWNNTTQLNYCLLMKGCKGQVTYADCPSLKWNDGASWCIQNNAPCAGCTEPNFYDKLAPLYVRTI